jgi:vacuolar-type H+-ATPase subunit I/STV1
VAAFTQIPDGGAVALTKDRACVTETSLEKSSRTAGKEFNGDELMKAALAEISASTASCRDRSVGLWQETVMFGDELGGIRDELRTVQRQLKDIKEATTTRDEEIYLEMDTLRRRMQENRNSRLEDLRDGQENVGALHKEMRSEIEMVQDELRTIQRRLMAALNQQPWDSELAASFLQNWLRQEAQVVKKNSDGDGSTRKKRPFMALLTKKLRKVLERAEMALQQLCRFPNRKDRHGKQRDMDESKAGTNTTLEGSRFAEKECSEDSELLCCDVVDIAHETQAD